MRILLLILLFAAGSQAYAGTITGGERPGKQRFVHCVFFWLNEDVTAIQEAEFKSLLKDFRKIKTVKSIYVGSAAQTPRTVVDNSYDVALIVEFRDKAGHDYYQEAQLHKDAIRIFEGWIAQLKIYDMINE